MITVYVTRSELFAPLQHALEQDQVIDIVTHDDTTVRGKVREIEDFCYADNRPYKRVRVEPK